MKIKLIILIFLVSAKAFACDCMQINKENISQFKESVDFILIGTVISHNDVNENEYFEQRWDLKKESYEVIVKVERIIKGKVKSDLVYITQTLSGNCSRSFKEGEKYVFSGNHILKFIDLTPEGTKKDSTQIAELVLPIHDYKNKTIGLTNMEFNFEKWNEISEKHILIHTDGCISKSLKSEFGKLIVNN